jgi:hypothetical protein
MVDAEQFNGWQQLYDSYTNGYPDRSAMAFIQPKRIQVKLLEPDLALALTWCLVSLPSSKQEMVRNSGLYGAAVGSERQRSCGQLDSSARPRGRGLSSGDQPGQPL